jgi:hypothetical protein
MAKRVQDNRNTAEFLQNEMNYSPQVDDYITHNQTRPWHKPMPDEIEQMYRQRLLPDDVGQYLSRTKINGPEYLALASLVSDKLLKDLRMPTQTRADRVHGMKEVAIDDLSTGILSRAPAQVDHLLLNPPSSLQQQQ